jgi:hypothetical protein
MISSYRRYSALDPRQAKAKTRAAQVAVLLSQGLTPKQIAAKLNVHICTIYKDTREIAPALDHSQEIINGLRMSLKKEAPPQTRVGVIKKTMQKVDSNPFAALRAVEMANYIDGVDRLLAPAAQQPQEIENAPMFQIASGAQVTLNLQQNIGLQPQHIVETESEKIIKE